MNCGIMTLDDLDLPLPWHRADETTWYADFEQVNRHALVKLIDGKYTMVVGTLKDMELSSIGDSLSEVIAIANRWIITIENGSEKAIEKIKRKLI